jgi:hypothetical protein
VTTPLVAYPFKAGDPVPGWLGTINGPGPLTFDNDCIVTLVDRGRVDLSIEIDRETRINVGEGGVVSGPISWGLGSRPADPGDVFRITPAPPDFRALLVRYISHVQDCEGVDFIRHGVHHNDDNFTPAEWALLKQLAEEGRNV